MDAQKHQQAKEQQMQSRKRANSETTEVPIPGETPTETFNSEISFKGVVFNSVKIFHPRNGESAFYLSRRKSLTRKGRGSWDGISR